MDRSRNRSPNSNDNRRHKSHGYSGGRERSDERDIRRKESNKTRYKTDSSNQETTNKRRSRSHSRDPDKSSNRRSRSPNHRKTDRNFTNDGRGKKSRFESQWVKKEKSPDWGRKNDADKEKLEVVKEKPNFGLSGKLTEETNLVNGVVVKYSEPVDGRKPKRRWRLYPFKGEKALPVLYIHRQSAYLMGRDRKVADIPLDHPSISKQHAALQYRLVSFTNEQGRQLKRIRPYIMDLESANGTFLNGDRLESRRFYEILERDVLKFGFSSREYVLLHEQSKDENLDDDIG